jgi:response regulator RpfG family c-di-GMP phosphodiesterase
LDVDYDLVLMDIQMPEMGGEEATAAIREREQSLGGHMPIIALTAHAMKGDEEGFMAAGMDAYVSKPIRIEELLEAIDRVVPDGAGVKAAGVTASEGLTEDEQEAWQEAMVTEQSEAAAPAAWVSSEFGLDVDEIMDRVDQDLELLDDLVSFIESSHVEALDKVEAAIAAGNGKELANAAHALKGIVSVVGTSPAFDAAHRFEGLGEEGDFATAREGFSEFKAGIGRFVEELKNSAKTVERPVDGTT